VSSTDLLVVGVNAYYSFESSVADIATTNWHTRLDQGAQFPVLSWLKGLGAIVAGAVVAVSCTDGLRNGSESDVDCGGSCSTKCGNGRACEVASDCVSKSCGNGSCADAGQSDVGTKGSCSVEAWSAGSAYTGGTRVSRNGSVFEACYWTQGNDPTGSASTCQGQFWKQIGPC
jgi:hypothetical protein